MKTFEELFHYLKTKQLEVTILKESINTLCIESRLKILVKEIIEVEKSKKTGFFKVWENIFKQKWFTFVKYTKNEMEKEIREVQLSTLNVFKRDELKEPDLKEVIKDKKKKNYLDEMIRRSTTMGTVIDLSKLYDYNPILNEIRKNSYWYKYIEPLIKEDKYVRAMCMDINNNAVKNKVFEKYDEAEKLYKKALIFSEISFGKKSYYYLDELTSVMSTLNSRIKSFEFYSCIIGSKLPIDYAIF